MPWRYAKDIVKRKIMMRELDDSLISMVLSGPDSVMPGLRGRRIGQKEHVKEGFGKLLIRVVCHRMPTLEDVCVIHPHAVCHDRTTYQSS